MFLTGITRPRTYPLLTPAVILGKHWPKSAASLILILFAGRIPLSVQISPPTSHGKMVLNPSKRYIIVAYRLLQAYLLGFTSYRQGFSRDHEEVVTDHRFLVFSSFASYESSMFPISDHFSDSSLHPATDEELIKIVLIVVLTLIGLFAVASIGFGIGKLIHLFMYPSKETVGQWKTLAESSEV